ncbi:hypothetical protein D3C71_1681190 [compost metagenome]
MWRVRRRRDLRERHYPAAPGPAWRAGAVFRTEYRAVARDQPPDRRRNARVAQCAGGVGAHRPWRDQGHPRSRRRRLRCADHSRRFRLGQEPLQLRHRRHRLHRTTGCPGPDRSVRRGRQTGRPDLHLAGTGGENLRPRRYLHHRQRYRHGGSAEQDGRYS